MDLTKQMLLRAVPTLNKDRVDEFVASFNQWAIPFGINNTKRIVMFLAQIFHESGELKCTEENLNYSAEALLKTFPKYFKTKAAADCYARNPKKIANRVYANRMGNGNEASGDGWKYRGRGLIQITGKENVTAYSKSDLCIIDALQNPDLLCEYPDCIKSAMWFWQTHGLNELADKDIDGTKKGEDIVKAITKVVNGGSNGLNQRLFYYRRFKKEFGI